MSKNELQDFVDNLCEATGTELPEISTEEFQKASRGLALSKGKDLTKAIAWMCNTYPAIRQISAVVVMQCLMHAQAGDLEQFMGTMLKVLARDVSK